MRASREQIRQMTESVGSDLQALKTRIEVLKTKDDFAVARQLLQAVREGHPAEVWVAQQLALCTYKDAELPTGPRLADALAVLETLGLRDSRCTDSETLALGGAVFKRRWQHTGLIEDLLESAAFYRAAWERNPDQDRGYAGVNAAFIFDLLAARAQTVANRTGTAASEADSLRAQARAIREDMRARLPEMLGSSPEQVAERWHASTLAEMYFGLADYEQARIYLARTASLSPSPWEHETTFRQLCTLARLQRVEPPPPGSDPESWEPPWRALHALLGEHTAQALGCVRGRVGLALSGGGFRASLFHLGVLARLAEMDVLRSVEALSTVSGGSIVGAHYYLEVKHLLERKADDEITRGDYVDIVRRMQREFLEGVAANLRTRTLSNLLHNVQMLCLPNSYTRSHRLGDLYEEHLYSRVPDGHGPATKREMRGQLIAPAGEDTQAPFRPGFSNWRRASKVPVLLLNATSLNSGHNWQFTARWMGEPPGLLGAEVDINRRYRRMFYEQAPSEELRGYRLGHAVAASACVPGLFDPLVIDGLYPGHTVRLVDGGVHDNQGVEGLLDQGCSFILCSDASGQMGDEPSPSDGTLGVPLRANSILMDRVREAEYQDLRAREESRALDGLFFVHLQQDLDASEVDWVGCQDPGEPAREASNVTGYGIDREVQRKIAAMRTDLDAFSEVEAHSLMLSGYCMTRHQFQQLQRRHERNGEVGTWGDFDVAAGSEPWPFLDLLPIASMPEDRQDVRRADLGVQLDVAAMLFFKVWKLDPTLRKAMMAGAAVLAVVVLGLVVNYWNTQWVPVRVTVGGVVLGLALFVGAMLIPLLNWVQPQKALRNYLVKAGLSVVGFVVAQVHLRVFDPIFLKRGRLKRLLDLDG
jgi:predicted acylesterase/phospholipase RssA